MKRTDKKFAFILVVMGIACLVSWKLYFKTYTQSDTVNIHNFPRRIGAWTSKDLPIPEREYAILETRNAFFRVYRHLSGKEVFLYIVYSQTNRKVSQPPEISYAGSGVSVVSHIKEVNFLPSHKIINVNKLLLEQGDTRQLAYYWFKVGDSFTHSYWKQQGLVALNTILGKPASSALIRISTVIKDANMEGAQQDVEDFASLIIPTLTTYLP